VWEDHLLPLITFMDAARLGSTCKTLRGVVREHFKSLGSLRMAKLPAALTTFPRARAVELWYSGLDAENALPQYLREGGLGRYLERVTVGYPKSPAADLIHEALQEGLLPSLKFVTAVLERDLHRASLTQGFLRAMHELRLLLEWRSYGGNVELQLAALGMVGQLPALAKLKLDFMTLGEPREPVQWPPFIPPSLKALRIFMIDGNLVEGLLPALPGMLAASGAKLNRLEFYLPYDFPCLEDGLINVAQALRCCSPTLKDFRLATEVDSLCIDKDDEDYEKQSERMRGRTCSPAWWAATSFRCSSFRRS
jgi:hypothetical protein